MLYSSITTTLNPIFNKRPTPTPVIISMANFHDPQTSNEESKQLIVGICVTAIFLGITIILFVAWSYCYMKTKRKRTNRAESEGTEMEIGEDAGLDGRVAHAGNCIASRAVARQLDDLVIGPVGEERCSCGR